MSAYQTNDDRIDDADQSYRSLSVLAVVAFVLGLASVFVLAADLLLIVPLMAIAVSLLALSRIAANSEVLTGRPLARTGLAIAVVCSVAWLVKGQMQQQLLAQQASPVAVAFIEHVLAEDFEQAYLLTLDPPERVPASFHDAAGQPTQAFQEYKRKAKLEQFRELPAGDQRYAGSERPLWQTRGRVQIVLHYLVGQVPLTVGLERSVASGESPGRWRVLWLSPEPSRS